MSKSYRSERFKDYDDYSGAVYRSEAKNVRNLKRKTNGRTLRDVYEGDDFDESYAYHKKGHRNF